MQRVSLMLPDHAFSGQQLTAIAVDAAYFGGTTSAAGMSADASGVGVIPPPLAAYQLVEPQSAVLLFPLLDRPVL
jgi:hypothetical protein